MLLSLVYISIALYATNQAFIDTLSPLRKTTSVVCIVTTLWQQISSS
jgi:hypothetical protein